jgi:tetratricopeptide (TPR) repeat protein
MAETGTKVIRVFLSSTFVDFQEERSLLVKQVFPSLRRRAKSRGVDIVDVDLRWGVTAEQTERGETLPLCLAEIDNCRPYFISLLGERYGWVPPADFYKPALLERQPWLKERMGGASVTELEILHGVLRNPEMAGHALFYLRDPAYAQAQQEAGWVADNPAEQERLHALKEQIRASGFPVAKGLPTPQAIAERIEADLWAVIERDHPEQEPPDALQREGQRHSDYRRSRTGLYLGGDAAIEQLESWIAEGEQRILITGESGAGKSALIANWLETHQRSAPQDLVHAHHLGCTNDASAVRPLLGRLIDTASQLLLAEDPTAEPLKVPQDWWELVFMVGDVIAKLSCSCQKQGCRWILVLDGLDRLAEDDQQALPWIPTTLPPGIHVVASALECPARQILQERQYRTHEIGPLGESEQQQLIERYLSRYTKQLESGLQQKILKHPLSGSPLFLRVLLEELRQCAWYDTLAEHLDFYLSAQTIDGLHAKVLERLEGDGHDDASRKALTALWASRAGLSENELLAFTKLTPRQWAPIELAMASTFGRNGNRLVFDHDYLRQTVEHRYLPTNEQQRQVHSDLADWFEAREGWDKRKSEELPWQLDQANRPSDLRELLLRPAILASLASHRGSREAINYWRSAKVENDRELDELLAEELEREIEKRKQNNDELIDFLFQITNVLTEAGLYSETLLKLVTMMVALDQEDCQEEDSINMEWFFSLPRLAQAHLDAGNYEKALDLFQKTLDARVHYLGPENLLSLQTLNGIGVARSGMGHYEEAEQSFKRVLSSYDQMLSPNHPDIFITTANLATNYARKGDLSMSIDLFKRCYDAQAKTVGPNHPFTLDTLGCLAYVLHENGDYEEAEAEFNLCLNSLVRLKGIEYLDTRWARRGLALVLSDLGRFKDASPLFQFELELVLRMHSPQSREALELIGYHAKNLRAGNELSESEYLFRALVSATRQVLEPSDLLIGLAFAGLSKTLEEAGKFEEAMAYSRLALDHSLEHTGAGSLYVNHNRLNLSSLLSQMGQNLQAINLLRQMQDSMRGNDRQDDDDLELIRKTNELIRSIEEMH